MPLILDKKDDFPLFHLIILSAIGGRTTRDEGTRALVFNTHITPYVRDTLALCRQVEDSPLFFSHNNFTKQKI